MTNIQPLISNFFHYTSISKLTKFHNSLILIYPRDYDPANI